MTVIFDAETHTLYLQDQCTVEEAETLHGFLLSHPQAQVDARACTHMHAAALQSLMAIGPVCAERPQDPFLRDLLDPIWSAYRPTENP